MRFPTGIILVCIRWYPLSYRQLEEVIQERGARPTSPCRIVLIQIKGGTMENGSEQPRDVVGVSLCREDALPAAWSRKLRVHGACEGH